MKLLPEQRRVLSEFIANEFSRFNKYFLCGYPFDRNSIYFYLASYKKEREEVNILLFFIAWAVLLLGAGLIFTSLRK